MRLRRHAEPSKWGYSSASGWGKRNAVIHERRSENARVEQGRSSSRRGVTGGSPSTRRATGHKGSGRWTYGSSRWREAALRAGTWPAIWMIPSHKSYAAAAGPTTARIAIRSTRLRPRLVHALGLRGNYHQSTQKTPGSTSRLRASGFTLRRRVTPEEVAARHDRHYFTFGRALKNLRPCKQWLSQAFHLLLTCRRGAWGGAKGIEDPSGPAMGSTTSGLSPADNTTTNVSRCLLNEQPSSRWLYPVNL